MQDYPDSYKDEYQIPEKSPYTHKINSQTHNKKVFRLIIKFIKPYNPSNLFLSDNMDEKLKTGTTTVGIVGKNGVVLAADKRASMGYLVAHKGFNKIYKITDNIVMTVAGSVGHAQKIVQLMRTEMRKYKIQKNKMPTVKACSSLLSNILFSYGLYVQLLMAGKDENGYHLYTLTPDGANVEDEYISTGSGSVMAYGVLEDKYQKDMDVTEIMRIAVRAVNSAIKRDVFSGNGIDLVVVDNKGVKVIEKEKINELIG